MEEKHIAVSRLYYVSRDEDHIIAMATIDGKERSICDLTYIGHEDVPEGKIMDFVAEVAAELGYYVDEDGLPFTVTITESLPPFAVERVLRLRAKSEEDAKRKAADWLVSTHAFFAEEGHATQKEVGKDVEIVDIVS